MQLDVLQYLLTRLSPQEGDKQKNGNEKKAHLEEVDRAVILETLTPNRVTAFELLCLYNPSLRTMHLGHLEPPLA